MNIEHIENIDNNNLNVQHISVYWLSSQPVRFDSVYRNIFMFYENVYCLFLHEMFGYFVSWIHEFVVNSIRSIYCSFDTCHNTWKCPISYSNILYDCLFLVLMSCVFHVSHLLYECVYCIRMLMNNSILFVFAQLKTK